jgi:nicotinamidase/pyrazinamidase
VRTVFVDVDTQMDFMFPAGALYVPGGERLLPLVSRLNQYAAAHAIPLISTTDAHLENDPEFRDWPPHCVAGTTGQLKPAETLLDRRTTLSVEPGSTIELADQVVVQKRALDVFTNPNFGRLLERLQADQYVVYGVATEYCVRCAVLGLLSTDKRVTVLTDAIAAVKAEDGARTLQECASRGAGLETSAPWLGGC